MVFSICDVELLRLLRWCRYTAPSDLLGFDELTIESLKTMKLIRSQRSSKYLTLTGKGNDFLERLYSSIPERMPVSYKAHDALRRARICQDCADLLRSRACRIYQQLALPE